MQGFLDSKVTDDANAWHSFPHDHPRPSCRWVAMHALKAPSTAGQMPDIADGSRPCGTVIAVGL